jgi:ABC-type Fe3+-hydroxamate transport system substrate-binding protein
VIDSALQPAICPANTRNLYRRILCVLAASCLAFSACSKEPATPTQQKTPPSGSSKAPQTTPARIVALSPAIAVVLRDLGYEPQIIARHVYDDVLPSALPAVGDQAGIDYEALLRLSPPPTHIFTQWGARDLPPRLQELAIKNHWTLANIEMNSLADIRAAVRTLDEAVQCTPSKSTTSHTSPPLPAYSPCSRAAQLISQLGTLLEAIQPSIQPSTQSSNPPPRVLLLIAAAPPAALGPGSCHDELLRAVGGLQALKDGRAYMELAHEDLVRLDPDAIILFLPRSRAGNSTEAGATPRDDPWKPLRPLKLRALESGRIAIIDDPQSLLPSTAVIPVSQRMRALVESWTSKGK